MKERWKERIDNANSLEQLRNAVADILHRNGFDVNALIDRDWLEVANELEDTEPEISELMAYADAMRSNLG